jgi:hypothetical protein
MTTPNDALVVSDSHKEGVAYLRTLLIKDNASQELEEARGVARVCGSKLFRVVLEEVDIDS